MYFSAFVELRTTISNSNTSPAGPQSTMRVIHMLPQILNINKSLSKKIVIRRCNCCKKCQWKRWLITTLVLVTHMPVVLRPGFLCRKRINTFKHASEFSISLSTIPPSATTRNLQVSSRNLNKYPNRREARCRSSRGLSWTRIILAQSFWLLSFSWFV